MDSKQGNLGASSSGQELNKQLQSLNNAQLHAVTSECKHTQVLAGPGSGKTRVLTIRVAFLIYEKQVAPPDILVATFTNKAAREIKERISSLTESSNIISGTFHSIAARYLRKYGSWIGSPQNFLIADQSQSTSLIKDVIKTFNQSLPEIERCNLTPNYAGSIISKLKAEQATPQQYAARRTSSKEIAAIYQLYEQKLHEAKTLDFDDLINRFCLLLEKCPRCVSNLRHILVDEFQDTNIAQYSLVRLLCRGSSAALTIVGDPDQSIYGFRSADIKNLIKMTADFENVQQFILDQNYRSSIEILDTAKAVIAQDKVRIAKDIYSVNMTCSRPTLRALHNVEIQASWIAREINRLKGIDCLNYSDFAVLVRSAASTRAIEHAFSQTGTPYKMVGGRKFYEREEIRDIMAYLKAAVFNDGLSIIRILNVPARRIGKQTIEVLLNEARDHSATLMETIEQASRGRTKVTQSSLKGLQSFVAHIGKLQGLAQQRQTTDCLISYIMTEVGYNAYLQSKYKEKDDYQTKLENVHELIEQSRLISDEMIRQHELPSLDDVASYSDGGNHVEKFLQSLALMTDVENNDDTTPRVVLSTIHAAKGLEWPIVFMPSLISGMMPHKMSEDIDEERRLLFVGITRAQSLLYLTYPTTGNTHLGLMNDADMPNELSYFISPEIERGLARLGPVLNDQLVDSLCQILSRERPELWIHSTDDESPPFQSCSRKDLAISTVSMPEPSGGQMISWASRLPKALSSTSIPKFVANDRERNLERSRLISEQKGPSMTALQGKPLPTIRYPKVAKIESPLKGFNQQCLHSASQGGVKDLIKSKENQHATHKPAQVNRNVQGPVPSFKNVPRSSQKRPPFHPISDNTRKRLGTSWRYTATPPKF